ncbi:MAG: RdgB/HAM1 family non-canonical purine NTP pyrophosphatase [Xanthomonadales bacterium]|nr:RdgB/HAM1 family non-canonical purine NTP pyrophosphatase [Xanthomonadales bacterium]
MRRLVLASGNSGKLAELAALLQPLGIEVRPQSDWDVPEAEETGTTFVENALLKARNAARHTGLPALGDDSGIVVDVLDGAPGIRSARYAGEGASGSEHIRKLLAALDGVPEAQRVAHFHCTMVLMRTPDDPAPYIATGRWHGRVLESPRGDGGFGYDPVFWVPGRGCSAAELDPVDKNRISHRGLALQALLGQLKGDGQVKNDGRG